MTLMKGISGIRGIVGDSLTPDLIVKVASAFAEFTKRGKVILGRDTRSTGSAIEKGIESALSLSGCQVINIGIVPTPTVQIMVEELEAGGGIVISASHNPIEWNAFKLINSSGIFLNSTEIKKFFDYMEDDFKYSRWSSIGDIKYDRSAEDIHVNRVTRVTEKESIKKKKFKVVLDSVNGAGSIITQKLLSEYGCETAPLYCEMTGSFPRGAEPVVENLSALSKAVLHERADIGFAQDPDADRLAIVDEKGAPIGEDNTIALVTEHLLSKEKGRVVINLSTTKAVDDIAFKYGVPVKRTRVGEINVVEEMVRGGARIGGEGNGGVISPEVHLGRDSLVAIGYILEMMSERGKKISELASDLPPYAMKKGKVKIERAAFDNSVLNKIKEKYPDENISDIDGLRIEFITDPDFKGGWVHLRPSGTEPVFRIITEGKNSGQADAIYNHFERLFTASFCV